MWSSLRTIQTNVFDFDTFEGSSTYCAILYIWGYNNVGARNNWFGFGHGTNISTSWCTSIVILFDKKICPKRNPKYRHIWYVCMIIVRFFDASETSSMVSTMFDWKVGVRYVLSNYYYVHNGLPIWLVLCCVWINQEMFEIRCYIVEWRYFAVSKTRMSYCASSQGCH